MAINKIQFQHGLSLSDFIDQFGTEAKCRRALRRARWPKGFVCPACAGRKHARLQRDGQRLWQCSACRRQTSLTAGTVFADTKLPLTIWFQALYHLVQTKTNMAALELMRHLGVNYKAAWRIKHKLMQAMTEREAGRRIGGWLQIDDAYLGGELQGGKSGRGSQNKQAFLIAVSATAKGKAEHVVLEPVASFTTVAIHDFTERRFIADSEIYSDGLAPFAVVTELDHAHTVVESDSPRTAAKAPSMQAVNTVLGNVKRAIDGTYHAIRQRKYAHRYLGEAAWRFNRRFKLKTLVTRLLITAVACQPWAETALRNVPSLSG